jgi:Arylsulfatase A and related enzymes
MKKGTITCVMIVFLVFAVHAQQKNVLLIAIDDLSDYVSLLQNYPGIKTPNLERFAKTAQLFNKAYCAAPVCNPSRVALLSGLAPYSSGVYDNTDDIKASQAIQNAALLPEHFKANGYVTITRGKIFHSIPPKERWQAMWDIDGGKGGYGPFLQERKLPAEIKAPPLFNWHPWTGPESDHPDNVTAEYIISQLATDYDKPFFMTCGFYKPHNPWTAPKRFFDMYPLDQVQLPKVFESDWDDLPEIAKKWAADPVDYEALKNSGKWKEVVQSYLACISFMDYNLGRVLDALDKSKYGNNTIVCVFADNGFHMGEKRHFAKYVLWEQSTHILYMWRVPGVTKPAAVCNRTVDLMSIYPTLVELCKLDKPKQQLDGKSIVPLLLDAKSKWDQPAVTTAGKGNQAIRTEQYRYIHYSDGSEELYDEIKDPKEWYNKANDPKMQPVIRLMNQYLQKEFTNAVHGANK